MMAVRTARWQARALMICGIVLLAGQSAVHSAAQTGTLPGHRPPPPDWDFQFDLFATMLEYQGLDPISWMSTRQDPAQWDAWFDDPAQGVVVLTGDVSKVTSRRTLRRYLSRGGSLLIATDHRVRVPGVFYIRSGPVAARSAHIAYQGYVDCLDLREFNRSSELFRGVDSVITNRCGWIASLSSSPGDLLWTIGLRLPEEIWPVTGAGLPLLAEAEVRESPGGRLILLADDSPLTNSMLSHGDNAQFVMNLGAALNAGNRTKFAVLHNGRAIRSRISDLLLQEAIARSARSDMSPEAIPELPLETLLKVSNHVIARVEDSDVLNESAVDRPRNTSDRNFRRAVLVTVAAVAVLFFLVRSWLTSDPRLPWRGLRDRRPAAVRNGRRPVQDYDRAAAGLSRHLCRELTDTHDPNMWAEELAPGGATYGQLCEQSHDPKATARALQHVLKWSVGTPPNRLSPKAFVRIGNSVQLLRQLHSADEIGHSGPAPAYRRETQSHG